jgi:hypothetical protein
MLLHPTDPALLPLMMMMILLLQQHQQGYCYP